MGEISLYQSRFHELFLYPLLILQFWFKFLSDLNSNLFSPNLLQIKQPLQQF